MDMSNDMMLITNGDSWTFGCEIVDPVLLAKHPGLQHLTEIDHLIENDSYRLSRIWPTILSKLLNANVINLAEPGDDNSSILIRTQEYILRLLNQGMPANKLFVIIGWTSPERRDFWYKSNDGKYSYKVKLNPHGVNSDQEPISELTKIYAMNFWNPEEYYVRYVATVINFQNFCTVNNIRFLNFNSFYRQKDKNIDKWHDVDISEQLLKLNIGRTAITNETDRINYAADYSIIWNKIDPIRYYNKDNINNSFKTFVDTHCTNGYSGWHPNHDGHKLWANELYRYIIEHKLLL